MLKKNTLLFFAIVICQNIFAQPQKPISIVKTFHVQSAGSWDYLKTCPSTNNLYVSHGAQVNILNKMTGDSVGVIENTTGVHGIAFDVKSMKGYTSNGKLNTVTVFDLKSNAVLMQIPVGQNPDAIMYEDFSQRIVTCNGRSKNLSFINPSTNVVTDSISLGGKPEEAVGNGKGKLYVNMEDENEIVEVDLKAMKVSNHWRLSPAEGPTGLALDKKTNRLFAGCDKVLIVMDATNGKLVAKVPIGDGCDGVVFDEATKMIYTSNGVGTITAIHEESANKYTVVETVKTKRGARTIALDKESHMIYVPTADFEAQEPNQKGRPKMIPGTFQVLVLGSK